VRPYDEFTLRDNTGIPGIDHVVFFVAEEWFAQRESNIFAMASES